MTELLTRPALQTLSMSSAQRSPRRRSARLAFEDEETTLQPAKKARIDGAGNDANDVSEERKTVVAGKKGKAAYDEDADGFQFSRAPKSKKAAPKQRRSSVKPAAAAPAPENAAADPAAATQTNTTNGAPARSAKKKRTSLQSSTPNGTSSPPKRRSARLSAEKAQEQIEPAQQQEVEPAKIPEVEKRAPETDKPTTENQDEDRGRARTPQAQPLHVQKKRSPTKIALPFADTPVILRNKEMRKTNNETRRRSSSQMRGRRASSLIDSGTSNAIPHGEVDVADFYKHIDQEIPETRRMKQLLIWCGTRALPERPTGSVEDVNAALAARVIQDELLREFANKSEMSNWFERDDVAPAAVIKKPNPRNVQNAAKLQELENEVKRLKQEKSNWELILGSLSSSLDKVIAESKAHPPDVTPSANTLDTTLLSSQEQDALAELTAEPNTLTDTASRLQELTKNFEFRVDSFADGVHKIEKYKETADALVSKVLADAASVLDERDKAATASAGTDNVSVRDLLKSLSRTA